MAWYEQGGPGAEHVRDAYRKKILNTHCIFGINQNGPVRTELEILRLCFLDNILERIINGNAGDYGTFCGFATFGLSRELKMQIETEIHAVVVKIRDQTKNYKETVCNEIIDFGMMPPVEHTGTINPEDDFRPCALLQRGGGIYLETAINYYSHKLLLTKLLLT